MTPERAPSADGHGNVGPGTTGTAGGAVGSVTGGGGTPGIGGNGIGRGRPGTMGGSCEGAPGSTPSEAAGGGGSSCVGRLRGAGVGCRGTVGITGIVILGTCSRTGRRNGVTSLASRIPHAAAEAASTRIPTSSMIGPSGLRPLQWSVPVATTPRLPAPVSP
jgi:hypothetical protein